jgi:hypothetical protein
MSEDEKPERVPMSEFAAYLDERDPTVLRPLRAAMDSPSVFAAMMMALGPSYAIATMHLSAGVIALGNEDPRYTNGDVLRKAAETAPDWSELREVIVYALVDTTEGK